jgi:hypothetical protein
MAFIRLTRGDFPMLGFWERGASAYQKALRQEYEAACKLLHARLSQSDDPQQRQAVMTELEDLKKDFKKRTEGMGRSLFGVR